MPAGRWQTRFPARLESLWKTDVRAYLKILTRWQPWIIEGFKTGSKIIKNSWPNCPLNFVIIIVTHIVFT